MTVCIVGNGPSMSGCGLGSVIDSHDVVIRVNNFRIYGCEKDVGEKRTKHYRAYKIVGPAIPDLQDDRYCDFDEAILFPIARVGFSKLPEIKQYKYWHEAPLDIVQRAKDEAMMTRNPTSGLMSIVHALTQWEHVDVCGFDCMVKPDTKEYGYYIPGAKSGTYSFSRHDFQGEHGALTRWVAEGRVTVLSPRLD